MSVHREFVVFCPNTPRDASFNFQNFMQGRVDMACRAASNAVFLSHGMRQDTIATLLLQGAPKPGPGAIVAAEDTIIRFESRRLKGLWPDDKSMANKMQKAVCGVLGWPPGVGKPPSAPSSLSKSEDQFPGISVSQTPLSKLLRNTLTAAAGGREFVTFEDELPIRWFGVSPIYLSENGTPAQEYFDALPPLSDTQQRRAFVVVIGGPDDASPAEEKILDELGFDRVSFGDPSLFASHCVVLANHYIDIWSGKNGISLKTAPVTKPDVSSNPHRAKKQRLAEK
eukprot:NODE_4995_length_993_cov_103.527586_g4788_i0.p1 GENE.NODE_4995_length_993_cov_103.527586_g4788_i0~~NODE_4995_length_993_cov_103.527586_g4788_i0.p1  ORF type:complete len:302 (-),score=48.50 NODE_4995_length_993_cov_103.527586_g4788_i0:87-935(-)